MTDDLGAQLRRAAGSTGAAPVGDIVARGQRRVRQRHRRAGMAVALVVVLLAGAITFAATRRRGGTRVRVVNTPSFVPASIPARNGDVDGDGLPDQVSVRVSGTSVTVVANMTRLGTQTIPVAVNSYLLTARPTLAPLLLGVVDVDRDGYAEILVQTDEGASTVVSTIIKLVDGRLTQVTLAGRPVALNMTGSVGHPSMVGCTDGRIVQILLEGQGAAFQSYAGERDVYALRGAQLVLLSKTTHTFATNGRPPSDAQLAAAGYLVSCPPLDAFR